MTCHLVLYTRQGCHLCDIAKELIEKQRRTFEFELQEVDIDGDAGLVQRFGDKVPVIEIAGRPRLWGNISDVLLVRLLKAECR